MTPETIITLGQRAMELAILVSAPLLLAVLVVGVLVSLFQAATQINEMTLSFVPKLLVLVVVFLAVAMVVFQSGGFRTEPGDSGVSW